jgi:glycyl-tRNA synthetase
VLKLHKDLAPTKIAILPLSRNERLVPKAREVFDLLKSEWMCDYDDAGSIGRRYRRQDEVGTPFCITVDFESLDDNAVTIRDRDTMSQDRIGTGALQPYLAERLT